MVSRIEDLKPIRVFYSYSHVDEALRNQLEVHLSVLKREGKIAGWKDRDISPGQEIDPAIDEALESAQIILLLVSPNFLASDYCYDREMRRALEKNESGEARVIPIIARHCDWQNAPFSKIKVVPTDGKPVISWADRDEAWLTVTREIRNVVGELERDADLGVIDFKKAVDRYIQEGIEGQNRLQAIITSFSFDMSGHGTSPERVLSSAANYMTAFADRLEASANSYLSIWQKILRYSGRYLPHITLESAADRKELEGLVLHLNQLSEEYSDSAAHLRALDGMLRENGGGSVVLTQVIRRMLKALASVAKIYDRVAQLKKTLGAQLQAKLR